MSARKLLTAEQVATKLNLFDKNGTPNARYVCELGRKGVIPRVKIPKFRPVLFDEEAINRLIDAFTVEAKVQQEPVSNVRSLKIEDKKQNSKGFQKQKGSLWID